MSRAIAAILGKLLLMDLGDAASVGQTWHLARFALRLVAGWR
jgi:hypothetical protein